MATKVYGPEDYKANPEKNPPTEHGDYKLGDIVFVDGEEEANYCVVSTQVLGDAGVTVIHRNSGLIRKIMGKDALLNDTKMRKLSNF
jgi:hypothetical protein